MACKRSTLTSYKKHKRKGTAQVRTEKLGGKIKVLKGVCRGDMLPPVMFTVAIEVFKRAVSTSTG